MALFREYLDLTAKYKTEYDELAIVFMQNGAFFEVYSLRDDENNYYGSNIADFSHICDLNVTDKKFGDKYCIIDGKPVVGAGFKIHLIDKYVKKMQDNGYTIVVYEEDDANGSEDRKTRSLTDVYSPGTYIDNDTSIITNVTCCIWLEMKKRRSKKEHKYDIHVGISLIDIYTGKTYISEYKEEWIKNPTTFDELERCISSYNPSETIIISNLILSDVNDIISFSNIKSRSIHIVNLNDTMRTKQTIRAENAQKQTYQVELLSRFYDNVDFLPFRENVEATQSFCYLLDFIYQHNPNLTNKIFEPIFENNNDKLILANHSLEQLNIIDDNNFKGKYSCVVKMLNECVTSIGKREFSHNFLNPTTDENKLNAEYEIIGHLLNIFHQPLFIIDGKPNKIVYANLKQMMSQIKDLSKINRQILLGRSSPKMIYQLYCGILLAKDMYQNILDTDEVLMEYLSSKIPEFENIAEYFDLVIQYIDRHFIIDQCKTLDNFQKIEDNFICYGVDDKLDNQTEHLMESQDKLECCRSYFNYLLQSEELILKKNKAKAKAQTQLASSSKRRSKQINVTDDIIETEDVEDGKTFIKMHVTEKNNVGLIATNKRCANLRKILNNKSTDERPLIDLNYESSYFKCSKTFAFDAKNVIFEKQSSTNQYITNEQLSVLCSTLATAKNDLIKINIKVFHQIILNMTELTDKINVICDFIKFVDVIYAKAMIAEKFNYCRPQISQQNGNKSFVNVVGLRHCLIEKIQQNELYVTNDLTIGDESMNGMLLYGTNAVGKTSFIRAVGISIIMAQAGLYVPASSFEFKPYKYIFTRILGNDNLFKGLSTFAVEMSELRTILRLADKNSLVLGDELCSGTESTSATSIFVAGIQNLNKLKCSFIFATHLHEILDYDEIVELDKVHVKHMAVIYNKELNCLVYNRKLQDGAGHNMYGLEVCKSLNLPEDFLENAHNIRMKYHPESSSLLDLKQSHFNAKQIVSMCDICKINVAEEVHHLQYQNEANKRGIINKNGLTFHKNNKANLTNICGECHDKMHKQNKQYKKSKTTSGKYILENVEDL